MNICVNGQSQIPPGFRFHPTEEELLQYYLKKKVRYEKIDLHVIREVDLNKLEPWDIQEKCKIGSTPQNDWYFFSHKDKKYPTGTRTNRATVAGFWKATGRDKVIYGNGKRIGMRNTLVFYKGRAPYGQKSDWIMYEYRLQDHHQHKSTSQTCVVWNVMGDGTQEEGWVVCRIFKQKKNHLKSLESPLLASSITEETRRNHLHHHHDDVFDSFDDEEGGLEQILDKMRGGNYCYEEEEEKHPNIINNNINGKVVAIPCGDMDSTGHGYGSFSKLHELESPKSINDGYHPFSFPNFAHHHQDAAIGIAISNVNDGFITNWAALDGLVASLLNGPTEPTMSSTATQDNYTNHIDMFLWNSHPSTS